MVIVRKGKIQTYAATMTEESLAALMAAMLPESLPETGEVLHRSCAVLAILAGLVASAATACKRCTGVDATDAS